MKTRVVGLMAAIGILGAAPVIAQDYAFQGFAASDAINQMQAAARDSMLGAGPSSRSQASPGTGARLRAPAGAAASALTYRVDPAVRRGVEERIVGAVSARDRASGAQLQAAFRQRNFIQLFDQGAARFGLRSGSVVDATTAYWLAMWAAANDQRDPYSLTQAQAVKAQVAQGFDFSAAGLNTPALRQEYAETLIYQALLLDAALNEAQSAGRVQDIRRLGDEAQRQMQGAGMNLRALHLTDQGFVSAD